MSISGNWLLKARTMAVGVAALVAIPGLASAGSSKLTASTDLLIGAGTGSACAAGSCPTYQNEANNLPGTMLDIYSNSKDTGNPSLLILAVPNNPLTGDPLQSASYNGNAVSISNGPGSIGKQTINYSTYSGDKSTGYYGEITGKNSDIYGFIGLVGNNSNNWTNLTTWDRVVNGIDATGFYVYIYQLDSEISAKTGLDVSYQLPVGTFAFGYGINSRDDTKYYDTAFTQSGLTTANVPEPASFLMLASGVAALLVASRRRVA